MNTKINSIISASIDVKTKLLADPIFLQKIETVFNKVKENTFVILFENLD